MKTIANVKKLKVSENWRYTEAWLDKKFGKYENDKLEKALQSESGSFSIRFYIYSNGPEIIATQRHINRFIDMVNNGKFDEAKDAAAMWKFINRLESLPHGGILERIDEDMDKLHAYNYQKAPDQVVKIIDNIDKMRREAKKTFDSLFKQLREVAQQIEQEELILKKQEFQEQHFLGKWDEVEIQHSKIREGIVYVLTNELMPGLVKIGFTAGNPDIRASKLSEKHALPSQFLVAGYVRTKDPYIVEQRVHSELTDFRVSGEFFKIDPVDALSIVHKYVLK